jgi:hypothetical protein
VLCLGAQTSVPLNDDERASVSDLAIKLSDGTNVALSLSFFNDESAGQIVPRSRSPQRRNLALGDSSIIRAPFEPTRYTRKDESKLGFVLMSMAALTLLVAYAACPQTFQRFGANVISFSNSLKGLVSHSAERSVKAAAGLAP